MSMTDGTYKRKLSNGNFRDEKFVIKKWRIFLDKLKSSLDTKKKLIISDY